MKKNVSLLFYLKKPKNYDSGNVTIYMRITVDGVPKELSTVDAKVDRLLMLTNELAGIWLQK
jgi:hypothetical protein